MPSTNAQSQKTSTYHIQKVGAHFDPRLSGETTWEPKNGLKISGILADYFFAQPENDIVAVIRRSDSDEKLSVLIKKNEIVKANKDEETGIYTLFLSYGTLMVSKPNVSSNSGEQKKDDVDNSSSMPEQTPA